MSTAAVVKDLYVLKDIGLGLHTAVIIPVVDQFGFEGMEPALHGALSQQSPLRLMLHITQCERNAR